MKKVTPVNQWTNHGKEVLILKCVNKDGTSYGGFKWPLQVGAEVEAPDFNRAQVCGGGLHGWPWGLAMGDGKEPVWDGAWLVFGALPEDVVDLGGKVKAKCGTIRFVGTWHPAMLFVLAGQMAWVEQAAEGAASATGDRGAASVTGCGGKARAGAFGCVALGRWNTEKKRGEMRCREVGCGDGSDGKLKANTWYRLNDAGEFVESSEVCA